MDSSCFYFHEEAGFLGGGGGVFPCETCRVKTSSAIDRVCAHIYNKLCGVKAAAILRSCDSCSVNSVLQSVMWWKMSKYHHVKSLPRPSHIQVAVIISG